MSPDGPGPTSGTHRRVRRSASSPSSIADAGPPPRHGASHRGPPRVPPRPTPTAPDRHRRRTTSATPPATAARTRRAARRARPPPGPRSCRRKPTKIAESTNSCPSHSHISHTARSRAPRRTPGAPGHPARIRGVRHEPQVGGDHREQRRQEPGQHDVHDLVPQEHRRVPLERARPPRAVRSRQTARSNAGRSPSARGTTTPNSARAITANEVLPHPTGGRPDADERREPHHVGGVKRGRRNVGPERRDHDAHRTTACTAAWSDGQTPPGLRTDTAARSTTASSVTSTPSMRRPPTRGHR